MYFSSSQVFVQCWSVSCYCGHQGTVVYCSICHLSFGDLQVQMFFVLLCFSNITVLLLWTHTFQSLQEKFRCSVGILSVPLPTSYIISTVIACKSHFSSFKSMIFSRERCYCISKNTLWEKKQNRTMVIFDICAPSVIVSSLIFFHRRI